MRRSVVRMSLALGLVLGLVGTAHADAKRKARGNKPEPAPTSDVIAKDLGELQWGMSMKQAVAHFVKKIDDKYRPLIAQTHSAMKEDQLRTKRRAEIRKIHDSIVRFEGETTGWDVSFLKGEFTHGNNEALFVVHDDNSQNFYFFIQDRLWKWYKAFDASVFDKSRFEHFASAIEGRYGEGAEREGEATPGAGERKWLEWQDKKTRLRAIDQTGFYGFYCLVFEDKATLRRLPELRRNQRQPQSETHALVDQVTSGEADDSDAHQDIADRITGRLRRRQNASEDGKKSKGASSTASAPPPPTGVSAEDDPLRGL